MAENKKITFVTGLFDIGRGELKSGFNRPFEKYLECFERLLTIDYPMVIYIEPQNEHIVWKHRSRENTVVMLKTLDDLRAFPFYNKIQEIRQKPEWYGQSGWMPDSTQATLELYNPLVMSKHFLLNDASLFNHFDTKYYMWIDAGISNTIGNPKDWIDENFQQRIAPHLNKMFYVAFPYDGTVEVHGFEKNALNRYAGTNTTYVCRGGLFGGEASALHEINDIYYHLLNDSLNNGYMGTEESIFTIIAHKYPKKCNVRFIDGNGLIIKFLSDLRSNTVVAPEPEYPLAIYALTYNLPQQFSMWIESFKKAYPEELANMKKYVINNSTDESVYETYKKLFEENGFEVIHQGTNIGINDGRVFAAEHFDKSNHKHYIFFEDDMLLVWDGDNPADYGESPRGMLLKGEPCKNGFIRYVPKLFEKAVAILEDNDLDFLRLNHTEVFGDCHHNWGYKNVAAHRRDEIFPDKGNADLKWRTRISHTATYKGLSYAIGEFHYSNWPLLFNKRGNHQLFLSDKYEHIYEQTLSSLSCQYVFDGKMKVGCLLASPINHFRKNHYDGSTRRENRHFKN
jgi:hypothetical protein